MLTFFFCCLECRFIDAVQNSVSCVARFTNQSEHPKVRPYCWKKDNVTQKKLSTYDHAGIVLAVSSSKNNEVNQPTSTTSENSDERALPPPQTDQQPDDQWPSIHHIIIRLLSYWLEQDISVHCTFEASFQTGTGSVLTQCFPSCFY